MITPVACAVPSRASDEPRLVRRNNVHVLPDTRLAGWMGVGAHGEEFFCNYEPNPEFLPRFAAAGLAINALGDNGELRGVEIAAHPFFVATLFQPQLTSVATGAPHPLITAYLRAAASA